MKKIPRSLRIGVILGLGLLVLINMAVFIAIFRQTNCQVESTGPFIEHEFTGEKVSNGKVRNVVLKGVEYLLGPTRCR